jgi:transposase
VQAAIDGVWASRKIDKLAHENVIYMYLTRSEKPDFRTKAEEELNTAKLF